MQTLDTHLLIGGENFTVNVIILIRIKGFEVFFAQQGVGKLSQTDLFNKNRNL